MHILGDSWQDGYLDYFCSSNQIRIQVTFWATVTPISDMYIEHPHSIRLIWEYLREIGPSAVISKIRSRLAESLRNKRFFSIGMGYLIENNSDAPLEIGTPVVFLAPCHPRCVERLTISKELIRSISPENVRKKSSMDGILFCDIPSLQSSIEPLIGWLIESGIPLTDFPIQTMFDHTLSAIAKVDLQQTTLLPLPKPSLIKTRNEVRLTSKKKRAVLFGLGNYAKTQIIRNISPDISLECVHEIDPTQIGKIDAIPWTVDSNPFPNKDEKYDAWFIAGYHHTHCDLAIEALKQGAYAVVEKPLVTNEEQLSRLLEVLEQHPGKLFTCFHMRYNPLFLIAQKDLGIDDPHPIHYYCTVFEVPLPQRHWYRWPNSGSHIISNGCHWLDNFLFLNNYSDPIQQKVNHCSNGDTHISIELENGAVFGMHLTHQGSSRLGMQDHIELRAKGITVKIDNGSRYFSEDGNQIIRILRSNRVNAYHRMYHTIRDKIVQDLPGDSIQSIKKTNYLMLKLEQMIK